MFTSRGRYEYVGTTAVTCSGLNCQAWTTAVADGYYTNYYGTHTDADFPVDAFKHWETYDPETGTAKSYLVATQAMQVRVAALDLEIELAAWETKHTENSQKYTDKVVEWLVDKAGLKIDTDFIDSKGYYKNYVFKKKIL